MVENAEFSRRYFPREQKRIPRPLEFEAIKPENTVRIFVFGESAAEGDPTPAFGFARMIPILLEQHFPGKRIEVINTAVTAINSHVIRSIARDAGKYSGDVWIVYMGNNEVVGPFGSSSAPLPLIRASIAAKSLRIGQLLENTLTGVRAKSSDGNSEEVFRNQMIPPGDPRLAAAHQNFRRNLSDIIAAGRGCGAKIVLSTLGSNLRDCPPFASVRRNGFAATNELADGIKFEAEGKFKEAIAKYALASEMDHRIAELHFRRARCHLALNQIEEAKKYFMLARDLDALRFRSDSEINSIIRDLAKGEIRLADSGKALQSAKEIPGEALFSDHVHFTFEGNYIVAQALCDEVLGGGKKPYPSIEECAQRLGFTDCGKFRSAETMLNRFRRAPFTGQFDHTIQLPRRERIVAELRKNDSANFAASVAIYEQAIVRRPDDWQLHDEFAKALLHHGDKAKAEGHLSRAAELLPHHDRTLVGNASPP